MKILVLGGDGFCGWPTALKLAAAEHEVIILDNGSRRSIDTELNSNSLTDIAPVSNRVIAAQKIFPYLIRSIHIDIAEEYERLATTIKNEQPDCIIHFAEQRAAPYSMLGEHGRRYTVDNNIRATHNVLSAMVDSGKDIHLVHLGTMGVYGYSKEFGAIPEGYLNITINQTEQETDILYPTNPGSIYHMTKSLDQLLFQFYNKNWGMRITDLHQGIVWGAQTEETQLAPELVNRFDYDGIYGTVLNRFIIQAAAGIPLTVYGTGGQTRAFIHISDTARCVKLAAENPPESGKVRIFNQVSEIRSVFELATMVAAKYEGKVSLVENPRNEAAENDLEVSNAGLRSLGFEPITLTDGLMDDIKFIAENCKDKINLDNILNSPTWK